MEPVKTNDAKGFAAALMRILLRFGLCHTLILDKASSFFGVFREVVLLLNLNSHVISSENHDAMLVERVNRFLNKGLRIMTNERESVRVACEAILLLIYAWNSAPIPGTDLPRSLVVCGRVFTFPIDISASKHLELTSTPESVVSYAKDQAVLLEASRTVAKVLLEEHRSWHRELVNSSRRDPRLYDIGDIVFAKRSTRSDARRGRVGKLMYPMTGPWKIVEKLDGASYKIEHCHSAGRTEKKHASMLSPFPLELVPFEPVDGPDNRFGQLFRPIGETPYKEAGIKGFTPPQPFKLPANFASGPDASDFYWPSLSELNEEMQPFPWLPGEQSLVEANDEFEDGYTPPVMYTGPPPSAPITSPPTIPDISTLAASIIASSDKLFLVAFAQSPSYREWRLVRVALADSISLHPACLQDGRFLVEFYVQHDADVRYNNINRRFWLQYHSASDLLSPVDTSQTHLIRPSDTSEHAAARKGYLPFRQWMNLTHEDTYIHGPFNFATINGRKTRDRVPLDVWQILLRSRSSYDNEPPKLDLPTYSVHVDRGVFHTFHSSAICAQLKDAAALLQTNREQLYADISS
jgi:hypothetical protein